MPDAQSAPDTALVEAVRRAIVLGMADALDSPPQKQAAVLRLVALHGQDEDRAIGNSVRAAIAAMEPHIEAQVAARLAADRADALDAAREAGRREGLEQAAAWHVNRADEATRQAEKALRRNEIEAASEWSHDCTEHRISAARIRALSAPPDAAGEG